MNRRVKNDDMARALGALGAENRLEILQLIRARALCVGAIAKKLSISQSAVSQHLRVLKEAGLVTAEKRGYYVHYQINAETFSKISTFAKGFMDATQTKCQSSECERR